MADAFKALSNPHRLQLFLELIHCCPLGTEWEGDPVRCVGELGQGLGVAPSTLSHHIKELNRSGLVQTERRGRNIVCRIDTNMVMALRDFFDFTSGGSCISPGQTGDSQ